VKVVGKGLTLIGTEGSCPPLPYIEVTASEGKVLIARGYAVEYAGAAEAEPEPAPKKAAKVEKASAPTKVDDDRTQLIADALDLIEGEPTVEAVADITGLADVTADEIAAAVAAKEAAEAANA
jgi:hypothetical protein